MEVYYSYPISHRKSICISTLTDEQLEESGAFSEFGGSGYYLYERDILDGEEELHILARLETDESAEKIAQFLYAVQPVLRRSRRVANSLSNSLIPAALAQPA